MAVWNCPPAPMQNSCLTCTQGEGQQLHEGHAYGIVSETHAGGQKEDSRVSSGKYFSSHRVLAVQRATNMYHSLQPRHTTPPPRGQQCQGADQHECLVSQTQNCLLLFTSVSVAMPVCSKCLAAPGTEEARLLLFNSLRIPHFVGNLHISIHMCVHVSMWLEYAAVRNISAISQLESR